MLPFCHFVMGQCLATPRRVPSSSNGSQRSHRQNSETFHEMSVRKGDSDYVEWPEPGKLRSSIRAGSSQLVEIPAGRRRFQTKDQDYIILKYDKTIENIVKNAELLKIRLGSILECYRKAIPMTHEIMNYRMVINALGRQYKEFFRDSAWDVDDHVQERKDIAAAAFSGLDNLRMSIDLLGARAQPKFSEAQDMTDFQIRKAHELSAHYKKTYKGPRARIFGRPPPKPMSPAMDDVEVIGDDADAEIFCGEVTDC